MNAAFTRGPGHACELARELFSQGYSRFVAVGGDGTLHEVVNGLQMGDPARAPVHVAVVPAGTGMDFARNAGLSTDVRSSVDRILRMDVRRLDLGLAQGHESRLFVNFAEVGIGASVVAREARQKLALPGRASFLMASLAEATRFRAPWGRVTVDGCMMYEGEMVSAIVANGRYFGGGMKIAPSAALDDGKLDVIVLGAFSRVELLTQVWMVYPGLHVGHPKVSVARGVNVTIERQEPSRLDLDGELSGARFTTYRFSALRAALPLLV